MNVLEILEPGSASQKLASFSSDVPFPSLEVGATINPVAEGRRYSEALIVVNVEVRIWVESKTTTVKTIVHTALKSNSGRALKAFRK